MKGRKRKGKAVFSLLLTGILFLLSGCVGSGGRQQEGDPSKQQSFTSFGAGETIRILSGSENRELGNILEKCAEETKVNIEISYQGSVDIMRDLEAGAEDYDAVWPASSLWISMGDQQHLVKHTESISNTPVVFGIRKSLAQELGFVGSEVSVKDILAAIQEGKMSFCMTSATQSNSGASAYIGFLYALLGKQDGITLADLEAPQLQQDMTRLLSGIERSSGSSEWLMDMFLEGNYDAMVNYECLVISTNQKLEEEGKEPLYVVYPYDGLNIADSPLGYVDHGEKNKEEAFLKIQEYLLSDSAQDEIQRTGRRTGYAGVKEENKDIFKPEWGIDTERILSTITMPSSEVLTQALNLYQSKLRKPSLTVYCLDFSGSMIGKGNDQLVQAMAQVLLQENAEKNFLQAGERDVNLVITFDNGIIHTYEAKDASPQSLEDLYKAVEEERPGGGTDIYLPAMAALREMRENYDLTQYTPAVILMTDGKSNGDTVFGDFQEFYLQEQMDVPVFSIMFGQAQESQLEELAALSNARVFDGRSDLIGAFRSVKGYN
ncbi:MAG: VWA domain-containing protein [Clostridiales bacterium]|nr:VWA domain-containing protein [Clostridiales bacterium]